MQILIQQTPTFPSDKSRAFQNPKVMTVLIWPVSSFCSQDVEVMLFLPSVQIFMLGVLGMARKYQGFAVFLQILPSVIFITSLL